MLVAQLLPATLRSTSAGVATGDRAEIQRLLDRRARALLERDQTAFMATVSRASPRFVRRQEKLFEVIADVPLASYDLRARWDRLGDLARPSDAARYPRAREVAIPLTEERYRIAGFDERPAAEDIYYTFVHEGGRWTIASDTDLDDIGLQSARHLWDFGRVSVEVSDHFLLMQHTCTDGDDCALSEERLAATAERALERVRAYWPLRWRERVPILVPSTSAELGRMIQATFDLDDFVAFAYFTLDLRHGYDYSGARILLSPSALEGRSDDQVLIVLAHELLHVATRGLSGPFVPIFVEEGVAEYVGYGQGSSYRAFVPASDETLPRDHEFLAGEASEIFRSYKQAEWAVRFFVSTWGMDSFVDFYRELGRRSVAAGTSRYHVDRALRRAVGIGFRSFERAWADSLAA